MEADDGDIMEHTGMSLNSSVVMLSSHRRLRSSFLVLLQKI
jgi:hypothetical protein